MNNTILISSPGAKTFVELIDEQPDLSAYNDPTLSILQAAFDNGDYEIIPDPEPVDETSPPNWDGLYQALMVSLAYNTLAGLALEPSTSIVDVPLNKVVAAILYGMQRPDSVAAIPAFQSAINLLLYVLAVNRLMLTSTQLTEVRDVLDANGFQSITLS